MTTVNSQETKDMLLDLQKTSIEAKKEIAPEKAALDTAKAINP